MNKGDSMENIMNGSSVKTLILFRIKNLEQAIAKAEELHMIRVDRTLKQTNKDIAEYDQLSFIQKFLRKKPKMMNLDEDVFENDSTLQKYKQEVNHLKRIYKTIQNQEQYFVDDKDLANYSASIA